MNQIQIMSNEWYDILYINENRISRKTNNDCGLYNINKKKLTIDWDGWGEETFIKIDNMYYKDHYNEFKIQLESNDFFDEALIYPKSRNINLINKGYSGIFKFDSLKLVIKWNHNKVEETF